MFPNLIVILGPTASGKTKLAAGLAAELQTEVISADSRQVYKQMNIGTGKDLHEFNVKGYPVPYHLIDILPAGERYHINQFITDFFTAFRQIQFLHKTPILCGGTGLYIDAILSNFEYTGIPVNFALRAQLSHLTKAELEHLFESLPHHPHKKQIDTSTDKRLIRGIEIITHLNEQTYTPPPVPEIIPLIFGMDIPIEIRRKKIKTRLTDRLNNGLVDEVESLLRTLTKEQLMYYGLEYKLITQYLIRELTYSEMVDQLLVSIQQYAKRQMTYFRKMEKDGKKIHWIDAMLPLEKQLSAVNLILSDAEIKSSN